MNKTNSAALFAGIALIFFSASVASAAQAEPPSETNPQAAAPQDRPADPAPQEDEDDEPFRIGAIAGIGFPRPLAIEGMIEVGGVLALGIEYSTMPKTSIMGVDTRFWALAGDARLFPFKGGFFIGLRGGRQVLTASTTIDLGAYGAYAQSGAAETWFVNPRIGFLWTWSSGFTVGIDAGVQIPIGPSLTTTLPAGLPPQVDATIASVANTFGNGVTPTVDLLRVGFLF